MKLPQPRAPELPTTPLPRPRGRPRSSTSVRMLEATAPKGRSTTQLYDVDRSRPTLATRAEKRRARGAGKNAIPASERSIHTPPFAANPSYPDSDSHSDSNPWLPALASSPRRVEGSPLPLTQTRAAGQAPVDDGLARLTRALAMLSIRSASVPRGTHIDIRRHDASAILGRVPAKDVIEVIEVSD
ncbi:hypothetical protein OBBRIDRAFT_154040 [Obba rivulosa]|uniref:Uncharacterized protein n=1 Tax=Obba rivulosa TaxID=1052685 RepID=A0A8E2AQG4_9APHY|nr:hypothetical protein OBBRIDRAFT_154040 [Obba rivulosa]